MTIAQVQAEQMAVGGLIGWNPVRTYARTQAGRNRGLRPSTIARTQSLGGLVQRRGRRSPKPQVGVRFPGPPLEDRRGVTVILTRIRRSGFTTAAAASCSRPPPICRCTAPLSATWRSAWPRQGCRGRGLPRWHGGTAARAMKCVRLPTLTDRARSAPYRPARRSISAEAARRAPASPGSASARSRTPSRSARTCSAPGCAGSRYGRLGFA